MSVKTETASAARAVEFLASLPKNNIDLTAINAASGKISARSFNKANAEDRDACVKAIATATKNGCGLYFNVNTLSVSLGPQRSKANESEVATLNGFHVDADVDKTITDPAAFAKAKSEQLDAIRGMNKPPTIIIDSGNGFGLFWLLRKSVKVTDANRDLLKGINIELRDAVPGSADAVKISTA